MNQFVAFALYLCVSAMMLIVWPVLMHPTLSPTRKLLISSFAFFVIVPIGLGLYAWLGVPSMATTH